MLRRILLHLNPEGPAVESEHSEDATRDLRGLNAVGFDVALPNWLEHSNGTLS